MSTKRSKRHQLIVRVSNMNREYDKNHGIKVHDPIFIMLGIKHTPKKRYKNIMAEHQHRIAKEFPNDVCYKDRKTRHIRQIIEAVKGTDRLKGTGTIK